MNIKKYEQEIDIWALGCTFYFIMTGINFIDILMFETNKDILERIFLKLNVPDNKVWTGIANRLKELEIRNTKLTHLYPFDRLFYDCLREIDVLKNEYNKKYEKEGYLNPENRPTIYELLIKYKF